MRNLLALCAAVIVILGIVSVNLWRDLRTERLLVQELRSHGTQPLAPDTRPAPQQALPPRPPDAGVVPVAPGPAADARAQLPIVLPVALPAAPPMAPARLTAAQEEARRTLAFIDSDQTATARVLQWKDRLTIAGQPLTTEQLQALNTSALAQMRRETEAGLAIQDPTGPIDQETAFRLREENLTRMHDTNLRILRDMAPHLTAEQSKALRAQFDAGNQRRVDALRAEREVTRQAQ